MIATAGPTPPILRPERGWRLVRITRLVQDTEPWTDPKTGDVIPPTFMWQGQLLASRSDGVDFWVGLSLSGAAGNKYLTGEAAEVSVDLQALLLTLESYRVCDCQVGRPCTEHPKQGHVPPDQA